MIEIGLNEKQFEKVFVQPQPPAPDRVGAMIRILPVLAAIAAALWTLILYFDTERQRNALENKRLEQQLASGDIERKKLENDVAIQTAQIRLNSLARRERDVSLTARKISETADGAIYAVDYTALLKNTAKVPTAIDYNMVSIYKGVFAANQTDFMVAIPPTWFDAAPTNAGAIRWTRLQCFFNKCDASRVDVDGIKKKYEPDVIDRTGTGEIVPGDVMKLGYSFYIKARPEDWIAVSYHGSFDKGVNADDNKTYIEWQQLRELAASTQQTNAPDSEPAVRVPNR